MSEFFLHEKLARQSGALEKLAGARIVVCGAGALGANLAEMLARSGAGWLRVIDRDRVEAHNLSTQPYFKTDVGSFKARILTHNLYRALGIKAEAVSDELAADNRGRLLEGADLVVDTFDNSSSRRLVGEYCAERGLPCLHAGMAVGFAEVLWNEVYRVPSATTGQDDCNYPLARTLVMLTASVAAEVVLGWLTNEQRRSFTITLEDLKICPFAG